MPSAASNPDDSSKTIARLRDRLSGCARAERRSIGRWLKRIETIRRSGRPVDRSLQKVERALEKALEADELVALEEVKASNPLKPPSTSRPLASAHSVRV